MYCGILTKAIWGDDCADDVENLRASQHFQSPSMGCAAGKSSAVSPTAEQDDPGDGLQPSSSASSDSSRASSPSPPEVPMPPGPASPQPPQLSSEPPAMPMAIDVKAEPETKEVPESSKEVGIMFELCRFNMFAFFFL